MLTGKILPFESVRVQTGNSTFKLGKFENSMLSLLWTGWKETMGSVVHQCESRACTSLRLAEAVENEELSEFGGRKVACEEAAGQIWNLWNPWDWGLERSKAPPLSSTPSYAWAKVRVKGLIYWHTHTSATQATEPQRMEHKCRGDAIQHLFKILSLASMPLCVCWLSSANSWWMIDLHCILKTALLYSKVPKARCQRSCQSRL